MGTFPEARRALLLLSPEKRWEKKSTHTGWRTRQERLAGLCADEHDGPQPWEPATERISSTPVLHQVLRGRMPRSRAELHSDAPEVHRAFSKCKVRECLLKPWLDGGKLRPTSLHTAGHHGGSKKRLWALGLRQKTAKTHLSKVQSHLQKARGRSSGPRVPGMQMLEAGLDS